IQPQLDRRRPGQSALTTERDEKDRVAILSGVENGRTLGTPLLLYVANQDQRPEDYEKMRDIPRPSHADYTYMMRYVIRARSGGGRASARETIGRVAAGAVAEKVLHENHAIQIVAWVQSVEKIQGPEQDIEKLTRTQVDRNPVRCPDQVTAEKMMLAIQEARDAKDSLGGVVMCVCRNVPAGWGDPVFEKVEARLAQAMLSIPATKGFEIGSGFSGTCMRGSSHNDLFVKKGDGLGTKTNFSGGIQGGITNGEPIYFRVAFKPPATIGLPQETSDFNGKPITLEASGRHDPCVVPRAVPIVEAMAALVLVQYVPG
ncbi:MAG: chorismate synthase, partial [Planctomycetes bacterium]|nr:chorismate synthase [Planctomycetota bacterium]